MISAESKLVALAGTAAQASRTDLLAAKVKLPESRLLCKLLLARWH